MTGDPKQDADASKHYLNALFQNAVKDTRLLDPSHQFVPAPFDADNLPDPTDSSIANAQLTANEAYTNGATKAAEALSTAQDGLDAANTRIDTVATTTTTLTTNLAAEATARAAADAALTTAAAAAQTAANTTLAQGPILHGQITVSNLNTTGVLTFPDQGGATLRAVLIPHSKFGTPPDGSFIVESIAYTTTTATVTVRTAPGASNVVTFDVILFIKFP